MNMNNFLQKRIENNRSRQLNSIENTEQLKYDSSHCSIVSTLAKYNSFHSSIVPTLAKYDSLPSSIAPTLAKWDSVHSSQAAFAFRSVLWVGVAGSLVLWVVGAGKLVRGVPAGVLAKCQRSQSRIVSTLG